MKIEDVQRVLIVGAGAMGQQIGLQCAMHGYDVMLYDIAPEALETAAAQVRAYAEQLVAEGRLTQEEVCRDSQNNHDGRSPGGGG